MLNPAAIFSDITRDYYERTSASSARAIISKAQRTKTLKRLLRHHDDGEISDHDTKRRDAIDNLMSYYGIIEIGCCAGLMPNPLPTDFIDAAIVDLSNRHLRRYYQKHYPVRLPGQLLRRLSSGKGPQERVDDRVVSLFMRFLDLTLLIEKDDDVDAFLWFLEAGWYGDHSMKSVLEVLRDPRRFAMMVRRRPGRTNWTGRAIVGMRLFLEFSVELEQLLKDCGKRRHLRSAFYAFHEYWFRHASYKMRWVMTKVLAAYTKWPTNEPGMVATPRKRDVQRVLSCLRRLEVRPVK